RTTVWPALSSSWPIPWPPSSHGPKARPSFCSSPRKEPTMLPPTYRSHWISRARLFSSAGTPCPLSSRPLLSRRTFDLDIRASRPARIASLSCSSPWIRIVTTPSCNLVNAIGSPPLHLGERDVLPGLHHLREAPRTASDLAGPARVEHPH